MLKLHDYMRCLDHTRMLYVVYTVILCLLLLPTISTASPIQFWVSSSSGNDSNPGSEELPFATLLKAQLSMREAINTMGMSENATVTVLPDTYTSSSPLVFTPEDSGQNGFVVSWQATGAILYVGVALANWTLLPNSTTIYYTNVTAQYTPLPPPPPPNPPIPGCGIIEPGIDYNGNDIVSVLVADDDLAACCAACSAQEGCTAWSMCINITCGTPGKPINCYLKSSDTGRQPFGPQRTSGTITPPAPSPPPPWRFFNLLEGNTAAIIARVPNKGSGYLDSLGITNDDSSITWPNGSSYMPDSPFSVENSHVFCNLGADWFTETRPVVSLDYQANKLFFKPSSNGVAGCNNKAYLQGPKEFIDEPGEWALEPSLGLLYYYPYNASSLFLPTHPTSSNSIVVVATTSPFAISFDGTNKTSLFTTTTTATAATFSSTGGYVHDIELVGLEIRGSDFTSDGSYLVFPPGRPNDTPAPTNNGMIRATNAANIAIRGCKMIHAGLSAVWLDGWVQNFTVDGCWIENPGFCGVGTNGPYPGDGPYSTATDAYANKFQSITNNLIYNVGTRVGHGAGVWLFQTGNSLISNNYIKETPRNGVGMYGVRFGAGAGFGNGVLPSSLYGKELDFFSSLDVLTTRNNIVSYNQIENVVRDSCDAGAFEAWGVGTNNVFHTNSISDADSGGVDGSWMNFLFQDDASHWLNHSSNIVFNVAGKGSEEGGMIKSVFSVLENNIVAFSTLGHVFNLQPYLEPSAQMTFARNIFAYLTSTDNTNLDLSVNSYTGSTLASSCSLMTNPDTAIVYNFTNVTIPSIHDAVILEFDYNVYFNTTHNVLQVAQYGWDLHSLNDTDPLFVGGGGGVGAPVEAVHTSAKRIDDHHVAGITTTTTPPWQRKFADLALQPNSPVYSLIPGYRRIEVEKIGLGPSFSWNMSSWARRGGISGAKIQAETYDRQIGLWREGSYAISPGSNGWSFQPGAWAMYQRTDTVVAVTIVQLRVVAPLAANRTIGFAVDTPSNIVAVFNATTTIPNDLGIYNISIQKEGGITLQDATVFLVPDGACIIDWFRLLS